MPLRTDRERRAGDPDVPLHVPAELVRARLGPLAVTRDVEVEPAVAVVVEERRAEAPEVDQGAANRRGVAERAVAVVEVQDVGAEVRQVEVGLAVIVDVAHGHAVAEAAEAHARPFGHVLESEVAEVAIEPVAHRRVGRGQRQGAGAGEIQVLPAVAVVVEHGDPAPEGGREMLHGVEAAGVDERDPGTLGHVAEAEARRLARRGRRGGRCGRTLRRGRDGRPAPGHRAEQDGEEEGQGPRSDHPHGDAPIPPLGSGSAPRSPSARAARSFASSFRPRPW